jgi:hypothetical protein
MIGKVLLAIFALFLLFAVFMTPISDGLKSWRTDDATQGYSVSTGAGITTTNVTLSYDLYRASVTEVESITSNQSADSPVASVYVEVTKVLTITGLAESLTHTLTVNYYAETDDSTMRTIGPFLSILVFGGIIGLIFWGVSKKR